MTRDALDRYYTPQALARAAVERVSRIVPLGSSWTVLEPSSGGGAFVRELLALGDPPTVDTCDIDPEATRGNGRHHVGEFTEWEPGRKYDLIIGNPPFGKAREHIDHALELLEPDVGVLAFLLPLQFLASSSRLEWWKTRRPSVVDVVVPRPSFTSTGSDMQEIALYIWWVDELASGRSSLGHLSWAKPRAKVARDSAAPCDPRQVSIFDVAEAAQ